MIGNAHEAYAIATKLTITGTAQEQLRLYIKTAMEADVVTQALTKYVTELNAALGVESKILGRLTPRLERFLGITRGTSSAFASMAPQLQTFNNKLAETDRRIGSVSKKMGAFHAKGGASMGFMGFTPGNIAVAAGVYSAYKGFKAGEETAVLKARAAYTNDPFYVQGQENFSKNYASKFKALDSNELRESYLDAQQFVAVKANVEHAAETASMIKTILKDNPDPRFSKIAQDPGKFIRATEMYTRNPADFMKNANMLGRQTFAEGISPQELFLFASQSKADFAGLDEVGMAELMALVKEKGGNRVGTGFNKFESSTGRTELKKSQVALYQKLGALDMRYAKRKTKGMNSSYDLSDPRAWKDFDLKVRRPLEWIQKYEIDPLKKKFPYLSEAEQNNLLTQLHVGTSSVLSSGQFYQSKQIAASTEREQKSKGLVDIFDFSQDLPTEKINELTAALHNLFIAFGVVMTSSPVLFGINKLTYLVRTLGESLETIGNSPKILSAPLEASGNSGGLFKHFMPSDSGAMGFANMPTGAAAGGISLTGDLIVDRKSIGLVVANDFASKMGRPMTASSGVNGGMQYTQIGVNR